MSNKLNWHINSSGEETEVETNRRIKSLGYLVELHTAWKAAYSDKNTVEYGLQYH